MNSFFKDVVAVVFAPALQAVEVTVSTVAVASNLAKIFSLRFEKGLEARTKLLTSLNATDDGDKQQAIARRIVAKDMELEVLRNFHSVCQEAELELEAKLPAASSLDTASIGEIAPLDEKAAQKS